jgi:hypothetical protein
VLTYSSHDRANCVWHRVAERGEAAIGCSGASEPTNDISDIRYAGLDYKYTLEDFSTRIVNVRASEAFNHGGFRPEGAHSDFFYEESIHLVLSLANFVHGEALLPD